MKKGLNPVLYIEQYSHLGPHMLNVFSQFYNKPNPTEFEYNIAEVIRYLKNYEGTLKRRNKPPVLNYRFSDEREWRYIVPRDLLQPMFMVKGEYEEQLTEASKQIKQNVDLQRLDFVPDDINYIIIKEESEISEFIRILRDAKGKKFTQDQIERLMTRIITTERIEKDI
jgi:hypothetical protein